jgi:hypothetical protein
LILLGAVADRETINDFNNFHKLIHTHMIIKAILAASPLHRLDKGWDPPYFSIAHFP